MSGPLSSASPSSKSAAVSSDPRKIQVVHLIPTLDRSGAEKQCTLLATGLPPDEFDVQVIALTRGGPYERDLEAAGIPVTILDKRARFDPFAFLRLRRLLKSRRPDVLHTWLFAGNSYGRLCAHAIPQTRIVVAERCVDSWKAGWQLWLDRRLIARTDRMIGNSPGVVDFYRELGVPADKLVCIPNGVDVPETPARELDRSALLQELQLPQDAFVAGYIGRLARQKRVEDLIWAIETLRQIRQRLYLVIVGDGPERERLEEFTRNVHCTEHIRFVGHRDDALRYLPAFNAICLASSFEGMSNSLMEGMAAGLPAVASDIPPNRELVLQNQTGFLCRLGDTVGFMQSLRRLIDEPGLGARLGDAGRERIRSEFSITRMVNHHADVYRALAGR